MPRLVAEDTLKQKDAVCGPTKAPQSPEELAAHSLANMWLRLYHSYNSFQQLGATPFVVQRDLSQKTPTTDRLLTDSFWLSGLDASSPSENLIVRLFLCNEHFDSVSWVIAFCFLDKMHLNHYVCERLRRISLLRSPPSHSTAYHLYQDTILHTLFTAYCLAFKWHLDYAISLRYLVNLLPHTAVQRRRIFTATLHEEALFFQKLDYNCSVSPVHVYQLLDHFLTATERVYLVKLIAMH